MRNAKYIRTAKTLTLLDVHQATDLEPAWINRFENGRTKMVNHAKAQSLAAFYGCTIDELLLEVSPEGGLPPVEDSPGRAEPAITARRRATAARQAHNLEVGGSTPPAATSAPAEDTAEPQECWLCHQPGHFAYQCPEREGVA